MKALTYISHLPALLLTLLCMFTFGNVDAVELYNNMTSTLSEDSFSTSTDLSAFYDGTNLLIAANDGNGTEMCYWFKNCMSNSLFTFYRVGYRAVNSTASSAVGITSDRNIIWLNRTESDNIGPVGIDGYADFVGGNHSWRMADSKGAKGRGEYTSVKTASCDGVFISIDGQTLPTGSYIQGKSVKVEVFNTLYDPLVEPLRYASVLSSPLISEQVEYLIVGNSIDVKLTHVYAKDIKVRRYYGMQSMFVDETRLFTPDGKYSLGIYPSDNLSFSKGQYPLFNRFIEFNSNGWCQSSWLELAGLGQHSEIGNSSIIFTRGTGKSYHVLLNGSNVAANTTYRWHGVYTWAKPLVNDDSIMVYTGYIDGREALYVDVRKCLDNFCVMIPFHWLKAQRLERSGEIDATVSGNVLNVSASESGSVILIKKYYPDAVEDISFVPQVSNNNWYDMQGHTFLSEPMSAGIYIHNGKRTIIRQK